jgi:uncharacterized protein (TIGR00375 family)
MKIIADLHIHSAYSRGCSRELTLKNIAKWCRYKGIDLVSTGDFTYPAWLKSIKKELIPAGSGFYELADGSEKTRFVVGTEISCIYTQAGKCRRIHLCLLAPSIDADEKLTEQLNKRGCNLKSDGRPIIGLSAKELARIAWEVDENYFIFPAHAWTPWFSIFGSKSGFDSIEECFEELAPKITAIETGLSSDPAMNRRLSKLDKIALLSNSDAHSLANLGREANVFELKETEIDFSHLVEAIKDKKSFLSTIEFFPEEGKYHIDGHAACLYSCLPEESRKNNNLCPKCNKPLVLGVMNRVAALADKPDYDQSQFTPFKSLIPLQEIIADAYGVGKNSKKVQAEYLKIVARHSEFEVLLDLTETELLTVTSAEIARLIIKVRKKEVEIIAGYDGIFGRVKIKGSRGLKQEKLF